VNDIHAPDIVRLAALIRRHLANNPDSADTLEGVVNWWLIDQGAQDAKKVEIALDLLIRQQALRKIVNRDGTVIYRGLP